MKKQPALQLDHLHRRTQYATLRCGQWVSAIWLRWILLDHSGSNDVYVLGSDSYTVSTESRVDHQKHKFFLSVFLFAKNVQVYQYGKKFFKFYQYV